MSTEQMTVNLDEFLKYYLKKWKLIVGCIMLCTVCFAVAVNFLGEKIEVSPSKEYIALKEQEISFEEYIDNSVIMKMDPMNIHEITLYLDDISDRQLLKEYIESGTVWENSGQTLSTKYLTELVSWVEQENTEGIEVKLHHSDEAQCAEMAEYMAEKIQEFDTQICVIVSAQHIVMDETVSNSQMWHLNRLKDIQGQLEYVAAGYTIEASMPVAIALGILSGAVFSLFLLLAMFVFDSRRIKG